MNTFRFDKNLSSALFPESFGTDNTLASNDIINLWLLRIMVTLGGYKVFLGDRDFQNDALAKALGFTDHLGGCNSAKYNFSEVKIRLFNLWESAENDKTVFEFKNAELECNLQSLGKLVGLNAAELEIVKFTVCVHNNQLLESACSMLGQLNVRALIRVLSVCLEISESEVRLALHPTSLLSTSGILSVDSSCNYEFYSKVELLKGLVDSLEMHHQNPSEIFRNILHIAPESKLQAADYPHLEKDICIISQYLEQVFLNKRKGVNFLIYGIPGTGKTEFARMMSCELKANLYEINSGSVSAEALDEHDRFRAYSLGQILCARQSRSIILFDEVENIFKVTGTDNDENKKFNSKAWMNHVMENNPVPTFWISNDISDVDPAFIRRFDYVLEIKSPPRSMREKLLNDYLVGLPVSQDWKKQMAENQTLVPAIIERSANVIRMSGATQEQAGVETALESLFGNTIEAMGNPRPKLPAINSNFNYRLDMLNTNQQLDVLCNGLKENKEARICLYGPSGTGKTAFGRYIAEILDLPLLAKRASDIVSPYVGVTEQNMAEMFEQARQEQAVLMLDEADTFLSDRSNAQHSWEVSAVNEMLTQMESFNGLFIASTNYMDMIDSAAMRRFDIKLKFDYMKPAQIKTMFIELADQLHLNTIPNVITKLEKLMHVTPGDFAAVRRKSRLIPIASASELLVMLQEECLFKPESSHRSIGFH